MHSLVTFVFQSMLAQQWFKWSRQEISFYRDGKGAWVSEYGLRTIQEAIANWLDKAGKGKEMTDVANELWGYT